MPEYLTFRCDDGRFGLLSSAAAEVTWLPELTWLERVPPYVSGVMNLRGKIVPVVDLNRRLGYASSGYRLTQQVIILAGEAHPVGLIVDEVEDLVVIDEDDLSPPPDFGAWHTEAQDLITVLGKHDADVVAILSPDRVLDGTINVEDLAEEDDPPDPPARRFCPHAPDEVRQVFEARARDLARIPDGTNDDDGVPYAVARVGDEHVGLDLRSVELFADVGEVAPLPGAADGFLGLTNLRGEIVVLFDLGTLLEVGEREGRGKIAVIRAGNEPLGLLVDDIIEVVNADSGRLQEVEGDPASPGLIAATVTKGDELVGILDLDQIAERFSGDNTMTEGES